MALLSMVQLIKHRKVPWMGREALEELQNRKLRAAVHHAYEHVPFYRKLFDDAGGKPDDIRTDKDLAALPVTTKKELQSRPLEEITADDIPLEGCRSMIISGPSGQPFTVYFRPQDHRFLEMLWARGFLEDGLTFTDKRVSIEYRLPFRSLIQKFGIWRKDLLSVEIDPAAQVSAVKKMRPNVITGYPFDLEGLAMAVKAGGAEAEDTGINLKAAFSLGSYLSDEAREKIKGALGTAVFDFYGSGELGCIAWECEKHEGYHINSDAFVVEIAENGRQLPPGEEGEIICTSLQSYALPLIRYRTGDVGVLADGTCSCGRGLPLMSERKGKANTFVRTAEGKWVSPCLLVNILKVIPGIDQYKALQEKDGRFVVKLAKGRFFSERTVERVRSGLSGALGKTEIVIEVMDRIPADRPGEVWSIRSKIPMEL